LCNNDTTTNPSLSCYGCSQSSYSRCEITEDNINAGFVTKKTCATGQACGTRAFNDIIFRDCYDDCDATISGECVSCCNTPLCNKEKIEEVLPTCSAVITGQMVSVILVILVILILAHL
jgi:hypothetical protein